MMPLRHRLLGGCARIKYHCVVALLLHSSPKYLLETIVRDTMQNTGWVSAATVRGISSYA